MKKLYKLACLVFIPLVVGIALNIIGRNVGNAALTRAGSLMMSLGTGVTMFILVAVLLILMCTGKLSLKDETDNQDENEVTPTYSGGNLQNGSGNAEPADPFDSEITPKKAADGSPGQYSQKTATERERKRIDEINSSYGYDSQRKLAQYQIEQTSSNYHSASRGDKIKGGIFLAFLLTDFALIMVFMFFGITLGAFICMGIFAGTIIIALIVKVILEKTSMSDRVNPNKYEQKTATVLSTVLSSMTSTGGGRHGSSVRVTGVTYRIILLVDGKEYNAYSRMAFDPGEQIEVMVRKDGKGTARIIGD